MKPFIVKREPRVEQLSTQVTLEMKEMIGDLARRHNTKMSEIVRQMIQHCLDNMEGVIDQ